MKNSNPQKNPNGGLIKTFLLLLSFLLLIGFCVYVGHGYSPGIEKCSKEKLYEQVLASKVKSIKYDSYRQCLHVTKKKDHLSSGEKPDETHFTVDVGVEMKDFQKEYDHWLKRSGVFNNTNVAPPLELKEATYLDRAFASFSSWSRLLAPLIIIMVALFLMLGNPFDDHGWNGKGGTVWSNNKKVLTKLKDVQGMQEAKHQLADVIDFLKHPVKYSALGAKLPKGALMSGPPGTGKTFLARAIAGECGIPFLSVSGSSFDEVYVGVGSKRLRQLFATARKHAPCIIFIDEIDAIAKKRQYSFGDGGSGDAHTLNQLLTELDGFKKDSGIFVIGSTNRPKVIDPAVLRAGRLGKKIHTSLPTVEDRKSCFKYYMGKAVKLGPAVSATKLADQTARFSYADIAEVCNEAILIAARKNANEVGEKHFDDAIDSIIGGVAIKEKILKGKEKDIVAYHEAGHALLSCYLPNSEPLVRVTIIPRTTGTLGFAQYKDSEKFLQQRDHVLDNLCVGLGGMVAEQIMFGQPSTGSQNDLERLRKGLYDFVAFYGMSPKIGPLSFCYSEEQTGFMKPYSEKIAETIDQEVYRISEALYKKAFDILSTHKEELVIIAQELLKKEVLSRKEFDALLRGAPTVAKAPIEKDPGQVLPAPITETSPKVDVPKPEIDGDPVVEDEPK